MLIVCEEWRGRGEGGGGLNRGFTVSTFVDFLSGLHNCLKFSQPLSCLYQAMQRWKTFSIA